MDLEILTNSMTKAIFNVLEIMFFQPVQFSDKNGTVAQWFSGEENLMGASLDFKGPLTGSLYLFAPLPVVEEMTTNFLGLGAEEVEEEQKKDTLREALNMIGGHMLSLFDKEGAFKLGLPAIISTDELSAEGLEKFDGHIKFMETDENHLAVGVNLE